LSFYSDYCRDWLVAAGRSLDAVPSAAADRFMKMAEDVAASHGAIEALAAAIAVISGNDKPKSLLTATPVRIFPQCCGFVLFKYLYAAYLVCDYDKLSV